MQARRPGVSPLAIVLPHPPLPRCRSSLLSANSVSTPQTPRSCASPTCSSIFFTPSRKSTDSWNSSNADELEWEWKPEQVLLLSRTLDALPAHLVTPFNGPIPPSNLLDKIARGVSKAKGPVDWPHSLRATRVKLIELSRSKAREEALAHQRPRIIAEEPEIEIEDGSNYSYVPDGADRPITVGARRPLYRQSSMDFIEPAGTDIKQNDNIDRLSKRLQRSDRILANSGYHPYTRSSRAQANRRSSSPPPLANVPSLISPSTQSSDTLNSLSSFTSDRRVLRRSMSSMSSSMSITTDSGSGISIPDPRVQRIRRSETMNAPAPPPKTGVRPTVGFKRAPSYGALAQETRREHMAAVASNTHHVRNNSGSYPSSDEEEKSRTKQAKKARTKPVAGVLQSPAPASSIPSSSPPNRSSSSSPQPPPLPEKDRTHVKTRSKTVSPVQDENVKSPVSPVTARTKKASSKVDISKAATKEKAPAEKRPLPMNLQRNPSIFGPELVRLPQVRSNAQVPPPSPRGGIVTPTKARSPSPAPLTPLSPLILSPSAQIVPSTPALSPPPTQKVKTLRRVRRLAPARRISFGSLISPGGEDVDGVEAEQGGVRGCLGSAFQLL